MFSRVHFVLGAAFSLAGIPLVGRGDEPPAAPTEPPEPEPSPQPAAQAASPKPRPAKKPHVHGPNGVVRLPEHRPIEWSLDVLDGPPFKLSAHRGKVVFMNVFATWCPPCRAEATTLAFVAQQYQSAGVRFLGVDVRDNTPGALDFLHSHNITYPSVSDPDDTITLDFSSVVPISSTPSTLVIDKTGHVAGAVFGEVSYQELTTILGKVTARND